MIDRFTRWPEATPVQDLSTEKIAEAVVNTWVARFGALKTITTGQDTQFESQLFKALGNLLGYEGTKTTAYYSTANGIKRWHGSLKAAIRYQESRNWLQTLPIVLLGLRTSIRENIKAIATELVCGTTAGRIFFQRGFHTGTKFSYLISENTCGT